MKTLEKGGEKIKKICHALREETLEPAQEESKRILEEAKAERDRVLRQAEQEAKGIIANARKSVEQEKKVFETSLQQAAKQSVEVLRQEIEKQLFNKELYSLIEKGTASPQVVATLVEAIAKALAKDGLDADLEALVPKTLKAADVNKLIGQAILQKLKDGTVKLGGFSGGAQVRLVDKKMTIDISEGALVELLTGFLREDFRKLFFVH